MRLEDAPGDPDSYGGIAESSVPFTPDVFDDDLGFWEDGEVGGMIPGGSGST